MEAVRWQNTRLAADRLKRYNRNPAAVWRALYLYRILPLLRIGLAAHFDAQGTGGQDGSGRIGEPWAPLGKFGRDMREWRHVSESLPLLVNSGRLRAAVIQTKIDLAVKQCAVTIYVPKSPRYAVEHDMGGTYHRIPSRPLIRIPASIIAQINDAIRKEILDWVTGGNTPNSEAMDQVLG